jgi:hypothetical protein
VGLSAVAAIAALALREGLFGSPRHSGEPQHRHHD